MEKSKLRIAKSEVVTVNLNIYDERGDVLEFEDHGIQIRVRQARQGEVQELEPYSPRFERVLEESGRIRVVSPFKNEDYKARVVFMTLAGCNLYHDEPNENGEDVPIFKFKNDRISADMNEFIEVWKELPYNIADGIARACYEVNPTLAP